MLKSKKKVRRAARTWRVRKGAPRGGTTALADAPKCCTCGGTLTRMPRYLASASEGGDHFQCERCFYPETGLIPHGSGVVSSEETRRWTDISAWADLRAFKADN